MEHKLRVLVRFNIDLNCASIEVRGCLTRPGCAALLPVIRRARLLSGGMRVVINLRKARHIDEAALEHLRMLCAEEPRNPEEAAQIETPGTFPVCPVVRVLHNSDAARMAFLQRNPSVLGEGGATGNPARTGSRERTGSLELVPAQMVP
ncbi:MAG TPA: hypothetical protein VFI97_01725 [Arthrobacter sp.]|nr:hypothetical protein [Arthrobacter sp.]